MAAGRSSFRFQPAFDDGARQIAANETAFQAFDFEDRAVAARSLSSDAADAGNLFEALLDCCGVERAIAPADFEQHGFGAARAILQVAARNRSPPACPC